MFFEKIHCNQLLEEKGTSKIFVVTEKDEKRAFISECEYSFEEDQYEIVKPGYLVTITEANAICFRLFKDLNKIEVPTEEFHVTDGILTCDGKAIEMGEIYALSVIGKIPGTVLFTAKSENSIKICGYNPYTEEFVRYWYMTETPSFVKANGDTGFLFSYSFDEQTIADEVVVSGVDNMILDRKKKIDYSFDLPFVPLSEEAESMDENHFFVIRGEQIRLKSKTVDGKTFTVLDQKVPGFLIWDRDEWSDDFVSFTSSEEVVNAKIRYCKGVGLYILSDTELYFHKRNELIRTAALKELKDCNILVDIRRDGSEMVYSFRSEEYEVKELRKKKTNDRGAIYTVK